MTSSRKLDNNIVIQSQINKPSEKLKMESVTNFIVNSFLNLQRQHIIGIRKYDDGIVGNIQYQQLKIREP